MVQIYIREHYSNLKVMYFCGAQQDHIMLAAAPTRYSEPTFQFSQLKSQSQLKLCKLQVFSQVQTQKATPLWIQSLLSFTHKVKSMSLASQSCRIEDSDKLQVAGFGQVAKNVMFQQYYLSVMKICVNKKREMLTNVLRTLIDNPFKESFYGK